MMHNKKGFTLIELLIVLIIVGVLASISAPLMRGYVNKAKKSEAVTALGVIRTAERLYYAENGNYVNVANTEWTNTGPLSSYIKAGDLNGRYYIETDYNVVTSSGNRNFTATAINTALGSNVTISDTGTITGY